MGTATEATRRWADSIATNIPMLMGGVWLIQYIVVARSGFIGKNHDCLCISANVEFV